MNSSGYSSCAGPYGYVMNVVLSGLAAVQTFMISRGCSLNHLAKRRQATKFFAEKKLYHEALHARVQVRRAQALLWKPGRGSAMSDVRSSTSGAGSAGRCAPYFKREVASIWVISMSTGMISTINNLAFVDLSQNFFVLD